MRIDEILKPEDAELVNDFIRKYKSRLLPAEINDLKNADHWFDALDIMQIIKKRIADNDLEQKELSKPKHVPSSKGLKPGEKVGFIDSEERVVQTIKNACSQAINAFKETSTPLYRGFDNSPSTIFKGRPRLDRRTYTDSRLVDIFNRGFEEQGIVANRTNSFSCSANENQALQFGNVYFLLPVNGFKFSWKSAVEDFGDEFGNSLDDTDADFLIQKFEDYPLGLIKKYKFTNKGFNKALISGNEINILGEYYAIRKNTERSLMIFNRIMDLE